MPNQQRDPEAALQKLGQRIRAGHARRHPISERSLETVRTTVREQWEKEQQAKRARKPSPSTGKKRDRKPPEPGQD